LCHQAQQTRITDLDNISDKKPRLASGAAMKRMFNAFLDSKKATVKLL